MTQPNNPEFPSLGIFHCMASLIYKAINNRAWLIGDQNIYIPYYAAHIIGSYTMNRVGFAEKAVESGVILPLIELMKGKISWVEQRVAVRALGHLASYETTFEAVAEYEEDVVKLAMEIASTCLDVVYVKFVAVKDKSKRMKLKYHSDLLTRGVGGFEMENMKAEEWGSQLQCWSIYVLNCFASKGRSLNLMCKQEFLKDLCKMWGGLVNHTSPAGVGLIRILCYNQKGREGVAECKEVIESLCNLSRSSDDWQYMAIDCLLLLLKDPDTRYKVLETAALFLVDLIELRTLGKRSSVGEMITRTLLSDYKQIKTKEIKNNKALQKAHEEIWSLKVVRRKREKMFVEERVKDTRVLVSLIKHEGNLMYLAGEVEAAIVKYSKALDLCPLRLRKERMVLYSNRAQCHLILGDPDAAIRYSTRALCLSYPVNSHGKSLWRRSQAYDMKGLAKESLVDCLMFINSWFMKSETRKGVKIPYYAVRMISKQIDATWLFANARLRTSSNSTEVNKVQELDPVSDKTYNEEQKHDEMIRMISGLSTIKEEHSGSRRNLTRTKLRKKVVLA